MMNNEQIKSDRLNRLLKRANKGAKLDELYSLMTKWGVSKPTQEKYLKELRRVLNK
jgi:hypothetical protein